MDFLKSCADTPWQDKITAPPVSQIVDVFKCTSSANVFFDGWVTSFPFPTSWDQHGKFKIVRRRRGHWPGRLMRLYVWPTINRSVTVKSVVSNRQVNIAFTSVFKYQVPILPVCALPFDLSVVVMFRQCFHRGFFLRSTRPQHLTRKRTDQCAHDNCGQLFYKFSCQFSYPTFGLIHHLQSAIICKIRCREFARRCWLPKNLQSSQKWPKVKVKEVCEHSFSINGRRWLDLNSK